MIAISRCDVACIRHHVCVAQDHVSRTFYGCAHWIVAYRLLIKYILTATQDSMDRASRVLARGVPSGVLISYRTLADHDDVPHSTLHHRARGRPSIEEKARGQQYLYPYEEDVVVKYLLQMSDLGHPVRMKFIPSLAFRVTRHRSATERPLKPPGRNWSNALQKRHLELIARRFKALDWHRHENNTYGKIIHWFEVIKGIYQDPAALVGDVYNMDETEVMLLEDLRRIAFAIKHYETLLDRTHSNPPEFFARQRRRAFRNEQYIVHPVPILCTFLSSHNSTPYFWFSIKVQLAESVVLFVEHNAFCALGSDLAISKPSHSGFQDTAILLGASSPVARLSRHKLNTAIPNNFSK
jgi:hypothetical protein